MKLFSIILLLLTSIITFAQSPQQEIRLWPEGAPESVGTEEADQPRIFYYPAEKRELSNAMVVVCPGGGYQHLAMEKEGTKVAEWLNTLGVSAVVLQYRLGGNGYRYPAQLQDAQRAIRIVRSRATEWNINPTKVGIMGFSAGGHLAATAGTHYVMGDSLALDSISRQSTRPDFIILGYPVITMKKPYTHMGSRNQLLGQDANSKLVDELSNELHVNKDTPPAFLFHTGEDKSVPVQNSLLFYEAMLQVGVPGELHIFQKGRHGLGFGPKSSSFYAWREVCGRWLENIGML